MTTETIEELAQRLLDINTDATEKAAAELTRLTAEVERLTKERDELEQEGRKLKGLVWIERKAADEFEASCDEWRERAEAAERRAAKAVGKGEE